jgi:sodium transport system permease protein
MKSSLERISIVFWKEVTDNLRDRRSVASALASSLVGPVLLLIMILIIGKTVLSKFEDKPLNLPVAGAENAPSLILFLKQHGVQPLPAPALPEDAVRNGDVPAVLIIPDNYEQAFRTGQPASLQLVADSSRQSAITVVERTRQLLEAYNGQIATLRLLARGINPEVISPLAIENIDVATPQSQAVIFLNMMPYFVVLVVFLGGMYVIIDTTAGERERGSLEPLLINLVARWELVIGKLLASLPFAIVTLIITLIAFAVAFNVVPLEDYVGIQLSIDLKALGAIFLVALPMIFLASALQMIIATFTRSFKEAQTYVSFLPLIPALPGIGLAFVPIKENLWLMLIPTFGQQLLINQLMRGEAVNPLDVVVSSAATIVVSVLLVIIAIRLYQREEILFGTR